MPMTPEGINATTRTPPTFQRDDYVRVDEPGRLSPMFGFVEVARDDGQLLVSFRFGAMRWVWDLHTTLMMSAPAREVDVQS